MLSYFNTRFVKTGIFSKDLGRSVNKAFDLRIRGDYREQIALTIEQVEPYLEKAKNFIGAVRSYLATSGLI